jgi:hypothetical protein
MSAGSGFEADQTDANIAHFRKRKDQALTDLSKDQVLDDESRAELLKQIQNMGSGSRGANALRDENNAITDLMGKAQQAREGGTPVAEQRLKTKALRSALSNQPGRSQTVLSRG